MNFKTPAFWYKKGLSLPALLLWPISCLYRIGVAIDKALSPAPQKVEVPVICIGNAVTGGAGKTPTAIALAELIKSSGLYKSPAFLTRGYGDDEEFLLSKTAPTYKHKSRYIAALEAQQDGHDVLIMDDGLQHKSLYKDLSFMVVDSESEFGNSLLLPAGPLREPINAALSKTDALIVIGEAYQNALKPNFKATIETNINLDQNQKYIAFAGLARPEKFKRTLEGLGADIAEFIEFPDHYAYTQKDVQQLKLKAENIGAALITTEKDMVKLSRLEGTDAIQTLPITLEVDKKSALLTFIKEKL